MDFLGRADNAVAHMAEVVNTMTVANPKLGTMVAGYGEEVSVALYLRAGGMNLDEVTEFVQESSENPKAVMAMVAMADNSPDAAGAYALAQAELGADYALPLQDVQTPATGTEGDEPTAAPTKQRKRAAGAGRKAAKGPKALKSTKHLEVGDADASAEEADLEEPLEDEPAFAGAADEEAPGEASNPLVREELQAKAAAAEHYRAMQGMLNSFRSERYAPPTHDEAKALGVRIQQGDLQARNELVERNTRLLVRLASRYRYTGRSLEDLFQAGSFGLIRAAEKFDPTKGFAFSTYADAWIRTSISRYLASDETIRTPTHLRDREFSIRKRAREATTAGDMELARSLEAKADEMKRNRPTENNFVSTDAEIFGDSGDRTLHDILESEEMGLDQQLEAKKLVTWLLRASNGTQNEMHGEVFQMRMGLHPEHENEPMSFLQIGNILGYTAEGVRQMFESAMKEIKRDVVRWAKGEENLPENFFPMLKAAAGRG